MNLNVFKVPLWVLDQYFFSHQAWLHRLANGNSRYKINMPICQQQMHKRYINVVTNDNMPFTRLAYLGHSLTNFLSSSTFLGSKTLLIYPSDWVSLFHTEKDPICEPLCLFADISVLNRWFLGHRSMVFVGRRYWHQLVGKYSGAALLDQFQVWSPLHSNLQLQAPWSSQILTQRSSKWRSTNGSLGEVSSNQIHSAFPTWSVCNSAMISGQYGPTISRGSNSSYGWFPYNHEFVRNRHVALWRRPPIQTLSLWRRQGYSLDGQNALSCQPTTFPARSPRFLRRKEDGPSVTNPTANSWQVSVFFRKVRWKRLEVGREIIQTTWEKKK